MPQSSAFRKGLVFKEEATAAVSVRLSASLHNGHPQRLGGLLTSSLVLLFFLFKSCLLFRLLNPANEHIDDLCERCCTMSPQRFFRIRLYLSFYSCCLSVAPAAWGRPNQWHSLGALHRSHPISATENIIEKF